MSFQKESESLEFKKSTGELKEGIISLAAMLNKHGVGELYFGVRNDGVALGQDISEKTMRDISQAIASNIKPQIYPTIKEIIVDAKKCIYVSVSGNEQPYFAYGRGYMRVADEDQLMAPSELKKIIINTNNKQMRWDKSLSNRDITYINEELLMTYMTAANSTGRIGYKYTNKEDILNKLQLYVEGKLTNAATVLFCNDPELELQMAVFAGNERLTFIDMKSASGNVTDLVDIAEKYIKNNIHWRVEFDGSRQRKEVPEIPVEAIREALMNSFCHRDYRIQQNNEVAIFKDRIEIYNPGAFPEGTTPEDFIAGSERSIQVNPLLSKVLYYSKNVERFGTGLRRIYESCKKLNVKVGFTRLKKGFVVVFYRLSTAQSTTNLEKEAINQINERGRFYDKRATQKKAIITYISDTGNINNRDAVALLGVSTATAKRILREMVEQGVLLAVGEHRYRTYELKNKNDRL